jgi:hypothetical protein
VLCETHPKVRCLSQRFVLIIEEPTKRDNSILQLDESSSCGPSATVSFDYKAKVRSSSRSDLVLPVRVPRVSKYYAVRRGYKLGIFYSWSDCECLVKGFSGAEFKSFKSYQDALSYLRQGS